MTHDDALTLARMILSAWPRGGITTDVWVEVLEDLQRGPAEAAYRILRDSSEHQPSIAQLKGAYKAQLGTASEPRIDCFVCGGDGWETVHYEVFGLPNQGVKPCRCKAGDTVDKVHRGIVGHNNAELERLGRTPAPTHRIPA